MPIGVASMSFTCPIPTACTSLTWAGKAAPLVLAASAGQGFPKSTLSCCPTGHAGHDGQAAFRDIYFQRFDRVDGAGGKVDAPSANKFLGGAVLGRHAPARPKTGPICDAALAVSSGTVPWAMIRPPPAPASGPISMIVRFCQHLGVVVDKDDRVAVGNQVVHDAVQADDVRGCSPMDGSSSTYSTPVVRLRTARASCIRWRSPVESVADARSSVR